MGIMRRNVFIATLECDPRVKGNLFGFCSSPELGLYVPLHIQINQFNNNTRIIHINNISCVLFFITVYFLFFFRKRNSSYIPHNI